MIIQHFDEYELEDIIVFRAEDTGNEKYCAIDLCKDTGVLTPGHYWFNHFLNKYVGPYDGHDEAYEAGRKGLTN